MGLDGAEEEDVPTLDFSRLFQIRKETSMPLSTEVDCFYSLIDGFVYSFV